MNWRCRSALILVLAVAAFLRFYRLDAVPPGLYHDEAIDGDACLANLETGRVSVFYPENGGREGLYIGVATLTVGLFGNTTWAIRLPAAIFGVLTVAGLYLIVAELFSRPVGLLASFFAATSFWHIVFSRLALRAIAAPFFLVAGLYLLLVGLRRAREGRPDTGTLLFAGLLYGLGFYTYLAYRVTPVLAGLVLVHGSRTLRAKPFWKVLAAFCGTAILVIAPLGVYFWGHPGTMAGRISQISVANSAHPGWEVALNAWRTARMFFTHGDRNWRHNYAYRAELFWPAGLFFGVGIVVSLSQARRHFSSALMLAWLVVGAIPVILSDDSLPHALRSILLMPPTFILAAVGVRWLYHLLRRRAPKRTLIAAAAVLALMLVYEPYRTYFDQWAPRQEVAQSMESDAALIAAKINSQPRELPKYVVAPEDTAWTIQYLTRSYTVRERAETNIHYLLPAGDSCRGVPASLPPDSAVFCVEPRRGL